MQNKIDRSVKIDICSTRKHHRVIALMDQKQITAHIILVIYDMTFTGRVGALQANKSWCR